jgi:hypothetical protein
MDPEPLITAGYVGYLLNCSTQTVRKMARRGELKAAGAVFIGDHGIMFDPVRFFAWRDAGGDVPRKPESGDEHYFVRQEGTFRAHAGGPPRNDRSRRDPAGKLGELVKADPGVRPFDPMTQAPDPRVPPGLYLPGGEVLVCRK